MERLTIKNEEQNQYYPFATNGVSREDTYNKLGQLEDIEEELGIDLIKYFQVISSTHIYTKRGKAKIYKIETRRKNKELCVVLSGRWIGYEDIHNELVLPFSLYGRTWALTKEELEENK